MAKRLEGQGSGRNLGIEALRMVSMLMVVMLHVMGHGGILTAVAPGSWGYRVTWFWEVAAYCAVDCFALISGYVGVGSRVRYSGLAVLWLRVVFYGLAATAVYWLLAPGTVTGTNFLAAALPVSQSQYWYFTAYFALFFLQPLLNQGLLAMERKALDRVAMGVLAVFSLLPTLARWDVFRTSAGYSVIWLLCLYVLGGWMRRAELARRVRARWSLLAYGLLTLLTWGGKLALDRAGVDAQSVVNYISITVVFSAMALVLAFARLRVPRWLGRPVAFLAPSAFSVYLIHTQPLIQTRWMTGRFAALALRPAWQLAVLIPAAALGIYGACTAIDLVRRGLFTPLERKLRRLGEKREEK